ncbi:MAG: hypothetical protein ACI9CF_000602 [Candidatus Omnitrophota bacterium]|jgi:hypothetical protein
MMHFKRILTLAIVSTYMLILPASADEISILRDQMQVMQAEMQAMRIEMASLKGLEPSQLIKGPQVFRTKLPVQGIELGGEVEIEIVDTEDDVATGEPEQHMQIDKVRLELEVQINEDMRFEADIDFADGGVDLDEYYFIFQNLPLNSTLQVGLDDRFFKGPRGTERYPLAANAFWRDEELGLLWEAEVNDVYIAFSLSQGLELDTRDIGEDDSTGDAYALIHDDSRGAAYNGFHEFSGGLGYEFDLGEAGQLEILAWGLISKLSNADKAFLTTSLNNYSSTDDDQTRIGLNFEYSIGSLGLAGQFIDARDGDFDRYAWYLQPTFDFTLPVDWKYGTEQQLLFRYGQLMIDNDATFNLPGTWDREEYTFALITQIAENMKLKTEYTIAEEETGARDINNNELMLQLEYQF